MHLDKNIKILREKRKMTQEDLANEVGVVKQAVSAWENGEHYPPLEKVVKIAKIFDVTLDDLVLADLTPPIRLYARNIKYLREKHNITQEGLGQLIGMKSRSSFCLIENGKSIMSLEQKKETTEENRASQQTIIEENQRILSHREEIEEGVAKYTALVEEEKTLSEEATLYSVKATELLDLDKQIRENKSQLDELTGMLRSETSQKTLLEMSMDEEKIRAEASEYDKYYKLFQDMTDLQIKYNAAKGVSNEKLWKVNSKEKEINQELKALETKKADLEKRAELLENSGCSIADNSECRFLADAREAKAQLPLIESEISSYKESSEKKLNELKSQLDELEKKADSVGFDSTKLYDYTIKVPPE